ncbi:MAG: Na+/H+ antiporter subunit E [Oscillospiraceae bacterium]
MYLLFLLWLILNGKVTLEICLFGVVITGAVYAFCVAAWAAGLQTERRFLKRLGGYVVYGAILVREIIRANLAVMRVIWSRKRTITLPLVRVHAPLEKPVSRMLLSTPSP